VNTNQSIKSRLTGVIALLSALLLCIGIMGLFGIYRANDDLRSVYEDRTLGLSQITQIDRLILRNRLLLEESIIDPTPEVVQKKVAEAEANIAEITRLWDVFSKHELSAEEQGLAKQFGEARARFVKEGLSLAIDHLKKDEAHIAMQVDTDHVQRLYPAVKQSIDALNKQFVDKAQEAYQASQSRYYILLPIFILMIVAGIGIAAWLGRSLIRAIVAPLDQCVSVFGRIAEGHFDNQIKVEQNNEIGKVMNALAGMQVKLKEDVTETRRLTAEGLRLKVALDNVSASVMVADTERRIIYMNKSVETLFRNAEANIKQHLPNFDSSRLLGANIDSFHKDPSHQAKLLATFTATYKSTLHIGDRTMTVIANPVINEQGERLGSVVEWGDRTEEIAVENEVSGLVEAAVRGDFSQRIKLNDKDGFFLKLSEGINHLMETSERGISDVAEVLKALSEGDLTQQMQGDYQGLFAELKDNTNATVANLQDIVGQIREGTDAINTAAREIASGNADLSSRTESPGEQPGRDGELDGRTDLDGEAERRQRPSSEPACERRLGHRHQRRGRGGPSGAHHGRHLRLLEEDRRHHQRD
jgi:methyl-accepting chemotaxis protein